MVVFYKVFALNMSKIEISMRDIRHDLYNVFQLFVCLHSLHDTV